MSEAQFKVALGVWMRERRSALGLSQDNVALAMEVSKSAVSCWERGSRSISAYNHIRLKDFFKAETAKRRGVGGVL